MRIKEIEEFHDAINDPNAYATKIKTEIRPIIGYLCSYAPEELIDAAGFHPLRLFSSGSDIFHADSHFQAYCCSLVKGVLEDSLSGRLDFLFGTIFPHTCDTIQRLSDIWRMDGRYEFFADVVMPVKLNTQSARKYMKDVLIKFKKELESASGKTITDSDLSKSMVKYNIIRKNLLKIQNLKSENPGVIKGGDLYAIIKGSMVMDRNELALLLPKIVSKLENCEALKNDSKRIVFSGSVCDLPDIYSMIEDAKGVVIADDLCTGLRSYDHLMAEDTDPMEALVSRYFDRIICPAKHKNINERGEKLVKLVKQYNSDGVIFMLQKFCDPHSFDYPYMKELLDKNKIKSTLIEIDDRQQNIGQLSTRIETFIQMI